MSCSINRILARIGPSLMLAFLATTCVDSRADRHLSATSERIAKQVIEKNKCGSCHTLKARGLSLSGNIGPDLSREGQRGRSPDWLRQKIIDPGSIPEHTLLPEFGERQEFMPNFDRLSKQELSALIEFLQSLD